MKELVDRERGDWELCKRGGMTMVGITSILESALLQLKQREHELPNIFF